MVDSQAVLDKLQYISIPDSMKRRVGNFTIKPSIMLPFEPGSGELSWEMIIAGMLKILAFAPKHQHVEYYRSFLFAVEPDVVSHLSRLSILKARDKQWDLAEEMFLALVGLEPGNPRSLLNLALMYDQCSEDYLQRKNQQLQDISEERAFQSYKSALLAQPELPQAHYYAGKFFLRQKSFAKARKEFERFMDLSDDDEARTEAGEILKRLAVSSEREELFAEAFDFIRIGQEDEGLKRINKFLTIQPKIWNAWFVKGWALRKLEKYVDAYEAFSTAISLGGNSHDLFNEAAICLIETGDLEKAKSLLLHAHKISPQDIKVLSNLGVCFIKLKDPDRAAKYFRSVLVLDNKDRIARKYLDQLN